MRDPEGIGIEVQAHSQRPIPAAAVRALYDLMEWWPHRHVEDIGSHLERGGCFGAWAGEHLVGFVRAVSDGGFRAYVEDLMVHPEYRGRRVGTELMRVLLDFLGPIETVSLFCDRELLDHYSRLGFRYHSEQVVLHRPGEA